MSVSNVTDLIDYELLNSTAETVLAYVNSSNVHVAVLIVCCVVCLGVRVVTQGTQGRPETVVSETEVISTQYLSTSILIENNTLKKYISEHFAM